MRYRIQIYDGQLQMDITVRMHEVERIRSILNNCQMILKIIDQASEVTKVTATEGTEDDVILTSSISRTRG